MVLQQLWAKAIFSQIDALLWKFTPSHENCVSKRIALALGTDEDDNEEYAGTPGLHH